ncbi:hypothetical protein BJY01DRAFT_212398 [Aspergillus pseudoustus]|uniref:F-box domain-containing protein n=1 Tax=Aspergillus pseudoustus TaxID=1810923 RepID=A0ABR4K623_9EURO
MSIQETAIFPFKSAIEGEMAYCPTATRRSQQLLLSFPLEILHMILDYALSTFLYVDVTVWETLSCRVIAFTTVINCTKAIRGSCTLWASAARSLLFKGKATRHGCFVGLSRLMCPKQAQTFPFLQDCVVTLCHPYKLHDVHTLQQQLAQTTHSLEYVSGLTWDEDDPMDIMLGRTQGIGYEPHAGALVATFIEECLAAGLKIADTSGKRPNGGDHSDSERLRSAGLRAMKYFVFKEVLALWYYNAQIVRQILSAFPNLEYAAFPDFLHIPLVARMKYFFPQCEDDSPFVPISLSPPQMLQNIGISYTEGSRSYSEIIAALKVVKLSTMHYPAALALFPERFRRLHSEFGSFLILNQWTARRGERDFGVEVLQMLKAQMAAALADIPDKRKPTMFAVDDLKDALEDA